MHNAICVTKANIDTKVHEMGVTCSLNAIHKAQSNGSEFVDLQDVIERIIRVNSREN